MHVLLIDGFNLIRRIYEARRHDEKVLEVEVITSAAQSLSRALRKHKPSHACCIFDNHKPTWRHDLYPEYKKNRKPTPTPLRDAIPEFQTAFQKLGVRSLGLAYYEADDLIATLAFALGKKNEGVTILSTDKNFLQLLNNHIKIYDHFNDREYTAKWVLEKYGVRHDQLVDYWALTGDATNNIKGVPKIGAKTAQKLIAQYETLDTLLENPPEDVVGKRIQEYKQDAEDARELSQLKTDIKLGINLNQIRYLH